jgi:signal transduction histidine kinase
VLITTSMADTLQEPNARSFYYGMAGAGATVLIVLFALLLLHLQDRSLRMAESLGRARQRLQALNDELEAQVRERTGALEAAYHDLEAFSYTVAHDVRAPIAAIQGFAEALAPTVEATGVPKASHYLRRIVANATQMMELTESLLALGKLSRPPVEAVRVDITSMAQEVLAGLQEREGAGRNVQVSVDEGLAVRGDPVLVRQVLENLLGNAWKFSAARSPAVIGVRGVRDVGKVGEVDEVGELGDVGSQAGWITIAVSDNGEGFDHASAVGLFMPFRRMHAPGAFPGTGIGLATVERILRHHGGTAWIDSSPREGTTVFFRMRAEAGG